MDEFILNKLLSLLRSLFILNKFSLFILNKLSLFIYLCVCIYIYILSVYMCMLILFRELSGKEFKLLYYYCFNLSNTVFPNLEMGVLIP